jgi:Xaa-Pro dipeptidase
MSRAEGVYQSLLLLISNKIPLKLVIMNYKRRSLSLSERLSSKDQIDCIAITSLPNLRYFFNYFGESFERFCCGLLTRDGLKSALVVPALDKAKAESSNADAVFSWTDSEGFATALNGAMKNLRIKGHVIGCELGITLDRMDSFKSSRGTSNFISVTEEINNLRLIKDQEEIESTRKTASVLAGAYERIPDLVSEGKKELDVAFEIKKSLIELGAEDVDFCAVQSGKNSAVPHAHAGQKKIQRGDMIVVDTSCTNSTGYFADFTRTFVLGKANEKQTKVYGVVKEAQSAACEKSSAGVPAQEVDRTARSIIKKAGYGDYFVHRVGHGLGLEVHEQPWMVEGNATELERNMIFTVEPGIYIPGEFGVRIEDDLIVGKNGAENITHLSHDLVEI